MRGRPSRTYVRLDQIKCIQKECRSTCPTHLLLKTSRRDQLGQVSTQIVNAGVLVVDTRTEGNMKNTSIRAKRTHTYQGVVEGQKEV